MLQGFSGKWQFFLYNYQPLKTLMDSILIEIKIYLIIMGYPLDYPISPGHPGFFVCGMMGTYNKAHTHCNGIFCNLE